METLHYLDVLDLGHRTMYPREYLEIGVSKGLSAELVLDGTRATGVDPRPRVTAHLPRRFRLERRTSDEYFAKLHSQRRVPRLDFAFIDGLHLFEFALRDFLNCERYAHADSVIAIHDCLPPDERAARREPESSLWTGDVWKLLAYLLEERRDLEVCVLDAPPSGLVVVRGFGRAGDTRPQSDIERTFSELDFDHYTNSLLPELEVIRSTTDNAKMAFPQSSFQPSRDVLADVARRGDRRGKGASLWTQTRSLLGSPRGRSLLKDKALRR